MSKIHYILVILLISTICAAQMVELPIYKDVSKKIEQRVDDLLLRMTLEEKVDLLCGTDMFKTKGTNALEYRKFLCLMVRMDQIQESI